MALIKVPTQRKLTHQTWLNTPVTSINQRRMPKMQHTYKENLELPSDLGLDFTILSLLKLHTRFWLLYNLE